MVPSATISLPDRCSKYVLECSPFTNFRSHNIFFISLVKCRNGFLRFLLWLPNMMSNQELFLVMNTDP